MSLKFIEEFDQASQKTAPGSKGIAILNIFTVIGCILATPFTLGTSLFGLLAIPVYAALQSIANETYRTRLFTEIQTQIIAEKEGLFNNYPVRRRVRYVPIYDVKPIDEAEKIDDENLEDELEE